jgi:photosystem II stability/assembly factor-like uncharacterized protein
LDGKVQFIDEKRIWSQASWMSEVGSGAGKATILVTVDSGRVWHRLDSVLQPGAEEPPPFCLESNGRGWVFRTDEMGAQESVMETPDAGTTWRNTTPASGGRTLLAECVGEALVYAVRRGTTGKLLLAEFKEGRSTRQQHIPLAYAAFARFRKQGRGVVVGSSGDGAAMVASTDDSGATWRTERLGPGRPHAWTAQESAQQWIVLWLDNDGGSVVYRTLDSGKNWEEWPSPWSRRGGAYVSALAFDGSQRGIAFYRIGTGPQLMARTHDGGRTWGSGVQVPDIATCAAPADGQVRCSTQMGILRVGLDN